MHTRTKPNGWVRVGLGVRVPKRCTVWATDDDWPFEVELVLVVENFRTIVQRIELRRLDGSDQGVTADGLRVVPLAEIIRRALSSSVQFASAADETLTADPAELDDDARSARAAVIYRLAVLAGDPATQAVAQDLGVSRATAARVVARARAGGLLGPSLVTRAGEDDAALELLRERALLPPAGHDD